MCDDARMGTKDSPPFIRSMSSRIAPRPSLARSLDHLLRLLHLEGREARFVTQYHPCRTMSGVLENSDTPRQAQDARPAQQSTAHAPTTSSPPSNRKLRYADIAINLTDPVYLGTYHGRTVHPSDLPSVISRAQSTGCTKLMITGSSLASSTSALSLCASYPSTCFSTAGVHPCSTQDFAHHPGGPSALLSALSALITTHAHPAHGPVTAIGEIGLDYDRLSLSPRETQLEFFAKQLDLAVALGGPLPLFLHSRAAAEDFERLLRERLDKLPKRGLVHSFTGTVDEMRRLVEMGFDIGVNACSLRTEEGCEVAREIPLARLQVETDGPWCEMRPSHWSKRYLKEEEREEWRAVKKERFVMGRMVKGRNEPCLIAKVVEVVAGVKGVSVEAVAEAAWRNSVRMFGLGVADGEDDGKGEGPAASGSP